MDGVADCAIVGVPDAIMDEEIKAVAVPESAIEHADVVTYLKEYFPAYMVPRYVEFADAIPKTSNQKVQRYLLKEPADNIVDFQKRA